MRRRLRIASDARVAVLIAALGAAGLAGAATHDDEPATERPGRRAHHAMAFDPASARVMLSGGSTPLEGGGYELYDDVWALEGAHWTLVGRTGRPASGQRLAADAQGALLSFGGWNGEAQAGLYRLEGAQLVELAALDRPTNDGGFVYDRARARWVLFGGLGRSGQVHGDTWTFDGAAWALVSETGPAPRKAFALAYDERRERTVLFGGSGVAPPGGTSPRYADTWTFDGTTWTEVEVSGPAPPARLAAGCAYDALRAVTVVFGGLGADGMLGDTWSFDGTTWTLLAETGPEPRASGALAFDAAAGRIVLFGGRPGASAGDRADTWAWDGRRWSKLAD